MPVRHPIPHSFLLPLFKSHAYPLLSPLFLPPHIQPCPAITVSLISFSFLLTKPCLATTLSPYSFLLPPQKSHA
jgi:hypothetical protein